MCQSNPFWKICSQIESSPPSLRGKSSLVHQHLAGRSSILELPRDPPKLTVTTRILTFLVGESLQTCICHWNPVAQDGYHPSSICRSYHGEKLQHFLTEKNPFTTMFPPIGTCGFTMASAGIQWPVGCKFLGQVMSGKPFFGSVCLETHLGVSKK